MKKIFLTLVFAVCLLSGCGENGDNETITEPLATTAETSETAKTTYTTLATEDGVLPLPDEEEDVNLIQIGGRSYNLNATYIDLWRQELTSEDIVPLAQMKNLQHIDLQNNYITDLSPLAELKNLTYLQLMDNDISDLSPLSGLRNLETINLRGNNVKDLSPLAELPNLKTVYLYTNPVEDWSVVSHIENVYGNPETIEISRIEPFSDGMAVIGAGVWDNDGYIVGYMNESGEIVIEPQYRSNYWSIQSDRFSEGLAAVCGKRGKWGFIDKTGETVIPFEYEYANGFSEGLSGVAFPNEEDTYSYKWGVINKSGEWVVEPSYYWVGSFREGLAPVRDSDYQYGFIDKTGKLVIPCEYTNVGSFSDGLCPVAKYQGDGGYWGNKWGFIDKTGKVVIPLEYGYAEPFSEGLAGVVSFNENVDERKVGFIDKTGKLVIPFTYPHDWFYYDYPGGYDYFPRFSEGLAVVNAGNDKVFYISKTGETVISLKANRGGDFSDGFAAAFLYPNWGYIDKNGKFALPLEYEYVNDFSNGYAAVQKDGKWSVISVDDLNT